jgi:hypothetical protein
LRRKVRSDRRLGLPLENPLLFYPRYAATMISNHLRVGLLALKLWKLRRELRHDPKARDYTDLALTPPTDADLDDLDMFNNSVSSRAAGDKAKVLAARNHHVDSETAPVAYKAGNAEADRQEADAHFP